MSKLTFLAVTSAVLTFASAEAHAGSGYGKVSFESRTTTTLRFTWNSPSGKIRYATGRPLSQRYMICFKRTPSSGNACDFPTQFTGTRTHTLTALQVGKRYKVKVYAWTERKSFGKWKNRKYRLVGTKKWRTQKATPAGDIFDNGWIDNPGNEFGTIQCRIDWTDPDGYDLIQFGYKVKNSPRRLDYTLKVRGRPKDRWGSLNDEGYGWGSFNPKNVTEIRGVGPALQCRKYRIIAYAFKKGSKNGDTGTKIGEATAKAGGDCDGRKAPIKVIGVADAVNADHASIIDTWAKQLARHYRGVSHTPVRLHLAKHYQDFARRLPSLIEDNEIGTTDYELIQHIIEHDPALFLAWRKELEPIGLTLYQQVPPQLRSSIEDELETPNEVTVPRLFTGQHANSTNALPFGQTRGLVQSWHAGSTIPKGPITEIGWRAAEGATGPATTHQIEVILGNTTLQRNQISRTFARNLSQQAVTFLPMRRVSVPALSGTGNPNNALAWVKGTRPFVFTGRNLIVQVRTATTSNYQSLRGGQTQAFRAGQGGSYTSRSGWGCEGELDFQHSGSTVTLTATGVAPGLPVIFMLGFDNTKLANIVPLPMSLAPLGMGSCELSVDPRLPLTSIAGRNGQTALRFPVNPKRRLELHAQALHFTQSTSSGLATTNAAHLLLGNELATQLYNLTRDGAVAEFGPFPSNAGPVLMIR